jgi:hypothetical protein
MDRFFSDQNIDRLRKLRTGTAIERTALLALLDKEARRFMDEQRARAPRGHGESNGAPSGSAPA